MEAAAGSMVLVAMGLDAVMLLTEAQSFDEAQMVNPQFRAPSFMALCLARAVACLVAEQDKVETRNPCQDIFLTRYNFFESPSNQRRRPH